MNLGVVIFFCVSLVYISSCSHRIDKVSKHRKIVVAQGSLTFYPDSNVLIYRNNIGNRMDNEVLKPRPFYVKLPKGLKWYVMSNSQSFMFHYSNGQVVAINIDISDRANANDTIYEPTLVEVNDIVNSSFRDNSNKYDMKYIKHRDKRKDCVIKRGTATVLLYNVTAYNINEFRDCLKTFHFL